MFTRRIAASACALCLAVPAAAAAHPAHDQPAPAKAPVTYGDTKYDLQNQQDLGAPSPASGVAGDTKGDIGRGGPVAAPAPASIPAQNDGTNEWQIAAFVEGGLLAAFIIGSGLALSGRVRPRRRAAGLEV